MSIVEQLTKGLATGSVRVVDLSGPLGPNTPLLQLPEGWGVNTPPIEIHEISRYDERGPYWAWNWLKIGEHSGTHFDAPQHWASGQSYENGTTDRLDPATFVGPLKVLNFSAEAATDPDFLLTEDHIKAWEGEHGSIEEGDWVVLRSDWYRRAASSDDFLNEAHSPGPSTEAVRYLISKKIKGWGNEAIGTDWGQAATLEPPFPAHTLLHEAGLCGLASLAHLDELPPTGALLIAAPLKIENGTGSPIRALALVG